MQDDTINTNDNGAVEEVVEDQSQPVVDEPTTQQPLEEENSEQPEESETPEESTEDEGEETQGEEQAPPPPPSRREQLRIQQLLRKYGPPQERNAQAPLQPNQGLDYTQALDADPEVIQQLEADRQSVANAQYNEGLRRAEYLDWKTSLKIDAPVIEKKYPQLDPTSPEFHPAVADAVNNWYINMSGYDPRTKTVGNPNVGYAEFVEGFMELVQETAGQKNAQTVKNIAKQAATTGLRPDGSSAKALNLNKAPEDMTMEELYASIGQKPPKQ